MRHSLPGLILLFFLALIVNFFLQSHQLLSENLVLLSQLTRGKNIQKVSSSDFSSLRETKKLNLQKKPMKITAANSGWNKNLKVDNVLYDLYIPPNYGNNSSYILPCLLVLPGWDFPRTSWIENSKLVEYANKYGYALILPEMGKTLYESSYYPETQLKWNQIPGGKFIKERFIPEIQKRHNLLKQGQHNTLLGLSTGGRGIALIALENPDLFVAGGSLSGDFSQENTPKDRLMTAVYGSFNVFPERWQGKDNPQARVSEWKMPVYLAHGTVDDIVPESQSRLFYEALVKYRGNQIPVQYKAVKGAGHDYKFWGGQLEEVFEFFNKDWR
jgi:S-formylglutathione hydrolase FrmB